jgi:AmmeMemoRadiSam system protein B/AmmeMemoRadiSam system protein A
VQVLRASNRWGLVLKGETKLRGRKRWPMMMIFVLCLACRSASNADSDPEVNVRPAAAAGRFYPADAGHLKLAIQKFIEDSLPTAVIKPIAIIVPHAGYIFSGQISADGFRTAAKEQYELVVILGTNHTAPGFDKIALYSPGAFRTPLGAVPIDEVAANALMKEDRNCVARADVHQREHSVEVQVPFVQVLFPGSKILPVIVGSQDVATCTRFGQALAKVLKGRRALIVASSDLSHYPVYEDAVIADRQFLESVVKLDPNAVASAGQAILARGMADLSTAACGQAPIMSALAAAKALGASRGIVVSYANAGDCAVGDRSKTVGYGAVVFDAGKGSSNVEALKKPNDSYPTGPLQNSDRKSLLKFARQTLERYFATETVPLARKLAPILQRPQGAFVTLKKHGTLRGCIGHMIPDTPLGQTVGAMAMEAAFDDQRFNQLQPDEMQDLEIEVSVLTPWTPVARAEDIVIGRDGVVIRKEGHSAVFLPQVAVEQKWDRPTLLTNLCRKAGLPPDAWKNGAQFLVFQADVFSEGEYK